MKSKISYAMNILMFVFMIGYMFVTGDESGGTITVPLETKTKYCIVDFGMKEGLINLIEKTSANSFEEEIKLKFNCIEKENLTHRDTVDEGIKAKILKNKQKKIIGDISAKADKIIEKKELPDKSKKSLDKDVKELPDKDAKELPDKDVKAEIISTEIIIPDKVE
jgi:hypothetical protein